MLERVRNSVMLIAGDKEKFFFTAQEHLLEWAIKYFKDKKIDDKKFDMDFYLYKRNSYMMEFNPKVKISAQRKGEVNAC